MKSLIPLVLVILAGFYFTIGVRLGSVTIMPTQMFGAKGSAEYKFKTAEQGNRVGVKGTCTASKGAANFFMLTPEGGVASSASCIPGQTWQIDLMAGGNPGMYKLKIEYKDFSGKIDVREQRAGGSY